MKLSFSNFIIWFIKFYQTSSISYQPTYLPTYLRCRCGCRCGWRTFLSFKSLDNNMIYSSGIYIYIYICIQKESLQNKSLMGFKIWRSWRPDQLKLKSQYSGEFLFLVYKLVCWIWGICNKNPQRKKKRKRKRKRKENEKEQKKRKRKRRKSYKGLTPTLVCTNLPGVQARRRFFLKII